MRTKRKTTMCPLLVAALVLAALSTWAGSVTYDFSADPVSTGLKFGVNGGADTNTYPEATTWRSTGGNPGGFLAITYPKTYMNTTIIFPDLDAGQLVTAFKLEADLRVGNGSTRPADGFSISFARAGDPVLQYFDTEPGRGMAGDTYSGFAGGENAVISETGTSTGIAICFDTWQGNTLPDGGDIEGILVRVDNKTVLRKGLPTRYGACADTTSIQTGGRVGAFWTAAGSDPGLIYTQDAWTNLCWQHLSVELDAQAKLTVSWKGKTMLDHYQTAYFPTPGQIILAGRTGGSFESTHIDNLTLTTTAVPGESQPPTAPANMRVLELGARRVALAWDASVEQPDPSRGVWYEFEKDGAAVPGINVTNFWEDATNLKPSSIHTYRVRAYDVLNNKSAWASITVTNAAEVVIPGWFVGQIYDGITGTSVDDNLLTSTKYPNSPDRDGFYLQGLSFNVPSGEWGDNYGFRFAGTITPPESGQYRFFVASDDASSFYLNTNGAAIPDALTSTPIAKERDCCDPFFEPGQDQNDDGTFPTSDPITLTAGTKYGFLWLMKEGGGGDWAQVAWRKEGDSTPADQLRSIPGIFITDPAPSSDPVGASVSITSQPKDVTTVANERIELSVLATYTSPWEIVAAYQWFKDGKPLLKGDVATYVIPVAAQSDSGKYKAVVSVPGAQVTSTEVTVTVGADSKAPTIPSVVQVDDTFTNITVNFSEPVTSPSASTKGNYSLSGGATVNTATLSVDKFSVTLTTSKLTENTEYTLTVNNVQDNAANTIAANTAVKFTTWTLVPRRAKLEIWDGISSTSIDNLLADPHFADPPDRVYFRSGMSFGEETDFGNTYGDNYGARMTAFLIPNESGQYRFFVRSDDSSRLYINTTGQTFPDPNVATAIAQENDCCDPFFEPGQDANGDGTFPTSDAISLTASQKYPLLLLFKEGGGGDWAQVAMRKEGDATPAADLQPLRDLVYFLGPKAAPVIKIESITLSGGKIVIAWSGSARLQSTPTLVPANWADVTGAASGQPLDPPASGMVFYRLVSP